MVDFHTDQIPWRGIVIGGLVILAGTVTAAFVESPMLPAIVATTVLLVFLLLDERFSDEE